MVLILLVLYSNEFLIDIKEASVVVYFPVVCRHNLAGNRCRSQDDGEPRTSALRCGSTIQHM